MPASCYTVRPGPESGWLTFFELSPDRRCQGFFLALGPLSVSPESRRMAQGMARQIVSGYKRLLDPDPSGWLEELRELLAREQPNLEYGALVLGGERAHGLHVGRVRLVPLTAGARKRVERDTARPGEPFTLPVRNGDRFFLGRVPREAASSLPSAEEVQGLEQGGGGDGALILTIHSLHSGGGGGEATVAPRPAEAAPRTGPTPGSPAPRPSGRAARHARRGLGGILTLVVILLVGVAVAWWYFRGRTG